MDLQGVHDEDLVVDSEGEDFGGVGGSRLEVHDVPSSTIALDGGGGRRKKRAKVVISGQEEEDAQRDDSCAETSDAKENPQPPGPNRVPPVHHTEGSQTPARILYSSLTPQYTVASKVRSAPMSELIRRVNSLPVSASDSHSSSKKRRLGTVYSPYLKSSRSLLSRIAPLHPNRREPPAPLPPPPRKKKTKKELEREEKWEEELVESIGGITVWACMTDEERRVMRKAKREIELCGWED